MRDDRERNMMYQDQNMNFDAVGPEIPFMQSMRFPPNNDGQFVAEVSRKRKSMDVDLGYYGVPARFLGNLGDNMGHPLQREHTSLHNVAFPPRVDSQLKTPEMFFSHNQHVKPSNTESQYGNYQFYNMDNSVLGSETNDGNIKKAPFGSLQPFKYKECSFSIETPVHEIPKHHDSKHLVSDIASQNELSKFPSYYRQNSCLMEMSQTALMSNNGKSLGQGNDNLPPNHCLYPNTMPSKNLAIADSSHFRVVNETFQSAGGSFIKNFSKNRLGLAEVKEDGQDTWREEGRNTSVGTVNSTQMSAVSGGREAYDFHQFHNTETRSGNFKNKDVLGAHLNVREQSSATTPQMPVLTESSCPKDACLDHEMLKNSTHVSNVFEAKKLEKAVGLNSENQSPPSGVESSPKSGNGLASGLVEPGDGLPLNLEERTQSIAGKVSPLITEKLWDGSLQLNTSTTVSAVAFFKSGEKAHDIKWSEHVEIKGKVRLQAFEKFIQELPRSRNRALMVISLCWKVGSSKAGLTGMKEVAKGYKETEKVGFAQISPGFDLYVCPRSDTIITILAKYGFFKGMAAVEEDQDSLIGCVIWRRGHTLSVSVPKIAEKKKTTSSDQPPNSPEPSVPEINSPITLVDDPESKQEKAPSHLMSTPLDSTSSMVESKVFLSTNNSAHGSRSFHTISVSEVIPSMPYNSTLIPVQLPAVQKHESTTLQENTKHNEIPKTQAAEPEKPDGRAEPMRPILPGSPQILQGVQQHTHNQFRYGSHNLNPFPPPERRTSVPLDSPLIRPPLPITQNPDSSFGPIPMQSNSKPELTQPALPGPPPLPPDILQRIIQFSRDAHKASSEGMSKAANSFMLTEEPKKPNMGFAVEQKSTNLEDDDDGDLPEFDFDSACGFPKAPARKLPWSSHLTHYPVPPPFDNQFPVDGVRNVGIMKSVEIGQQGKSLNINQGTTTTLPARFREFNSDKRPADVQPLNQQFTAEIDKNSSIHSFSRKNRWNDDDDDDDDMPEWCPPDLEHLDQPKASTSARMLPPFPKLVPDNATKQPPVPALYPIPFRPLPPQSQSLSDGHQTGLLGPRPSTSNPAPMHHRPAAGFIPSDPRPPPVPYPNPSLRPPATNFCTKPSTSDVSWRWQRQ